MKVLHAQSQRMAPAVFIALIATCAGFLAGAAAADGPLRVVLFLGAALMIFVVIEFERMTVIVTDEQIVAGFRLIRSRTRVAEIESAAPETIGLWRHGLGLHFSLSGAMMITARTGPGIAIRRRGRLGLVISCDDPRSVLLALREAGARGVALGPEERPS
jgi:hypothetical protein